MTDRDEELRMRAGPGSGNRDLRVYEAIYDGLSRPGKELPGDFPERVMLAIQVSRASAPVSSLPVIFLGLAATAVVLLLMAGYVHIGGQLDLEGAMRLVLQMLTLLRQGLPAIAGLFVATLIMWLDGLLLGDPGEHLL